MPGANSISRSFEVPEKSSFSRPLLNVPAITSRLAAKPHASVAALIGLALISEITPCLSAVPQQSCGRDRMNVLFFALFAACNLPPRRLIRFALSRFA